MIHVRTILLIILMQLIQSTLITRVAIWGITPNLPLILLLFIVSKTGAVPGIVYGFFIGFLQDVYSPELLGHNAFTMSFMGYLIDISQERLTVENFSVKLFVILGVCLIHGILYTVLYTKFNTETFFQLFVWNIFPGALYSTGVAFIFLLVWRWVVDGGLLGNVRGIVGLR